MNNIRLDKESMRIEWLVGLPKKKKERTEHEKEGEDDRIATDTELRFRGANMEQCVQFDQNCVKCWILRFLYNRQ